MLSTATSVDRATSSSRKPSSATDMWTRALSSCAACARTRWRRFSSHSAAASALSLTSSLCFRHSMSRRVSSRRNPTCSRRLACAWRLSLASCSWYLRRRTCVRIPVPSAHARSTYTGWLRISARSTSGGVLAMYWRSISCESRAACSAASRWRWCCLDRALAFIWAASSRHPRPNERQHLMVPRWRCMCTHTTHPGAPPFAWPSFVLDVGRCLEAKECAAPVGVFGCAPPAVVQSLARVVGALLPQCAPDDLGAVCWRRLCSPLLLPQMPANAQCK